MKNFQRTLGYCILHAIFPDHHSVSVYSNVIRYTYNFHSST